jgi:hypothetical protein
VNTCRFQQVLLAAFLKACCPPLPADNMLGFVPEGVDPLKQPELITWKVSDLGCAFRFSSSLFNYPTTYVGTPGPAMSPEVQATKKARGSCHYNWPADVWAFAMLWLQIR